MANVTMNVHIDDDSRIRVSRIVGGQFQLQIGSLWLYCSHTVLEKVRDAIEALEAPRA
jgi:hypothetical protein